MFSNRTKKNIFALVPLRSFPKHINLWVAANSRSFLFIFNVWCSPRNWCRQNMLFIGFRKALERFRTNLVANLIQSIQQGRFGLYTSEQGSGELRNPSLTRRLIETLFQVKLKDYQQWVLPKFQKRRWQDLPGVYLQELNQIMSLQQGRNLKIIPYQSKNSPRKGFFSPVEKLQKEISKVQVKSYQFQSLRNTRLHRFHDVRSKRGIENGICPGQDFFCQIGAGLDLKIWRMMPKLIGTNQVFSIQLSSTNVSHLRELVGTEIM